MRFPNSLRVSSGVLVLASVFIFALVQVSASPKPPPAPTTSGPTPVKSGDKPGLFELLQKVIHDKELSKPESLKSKSKLGSQTNPRNPTAKRIAAPKTSKKSLFRTEILRQELTKESQENCLAKLLCGEGSKLPFNLTTTETSNVYSDYGLLVKQFLDIFSDDPYDDKPKPSEKDQKNKLEEDQDDDNDDDDDDTARSGENFVNITTSLVSVPDDEIITTSSTSTVSSITTGATITELYPITFTTSASNPPNGPSQVEVSEPNKMTLEEVVSQDKAMKKDLNNVRKSRHLNLELSFGNRKKSKYINSKIREMRSAKTKAEKLRIAVRIAARLREPRQCKQFENVASEILSTCPLTAEVVRYFNSNLKNGTQIALLKTQPQKDSGLVVLNDKDGVPHPYFLDHSPLIANTYINTDLKNPSVGDRFPVDNGIRHPIYEIAYPQKFNTAIVSLANDPKKDKTKKKQNKDSDEEETESDENDEDDEEDQNDDDDDQDEERTRHNPNNERSALNSKQKQQNRRIVIKVKPQIKKESPQKTRRLPQKKGVIQVYGVYQPSFDSEFSQTSTQIGTGPVRLFDHDYDGADVRYQKVKPTPKVNPTREPKPVAPPPKKKLVSSKPDSEQASNSDEEDDDEQDDVVEEAEEEDDQEEDEEDDEDYKKRSIIQKSQSQPHNLKKLVQLRQNPSYRRPHNFATTPNYGSFPAPRPEEYYQNGKPLRARPPTPMYSTPMIYKPRPRPELRRLNIVHSPGSALMRPPFKRPGRYQRY